MPTAKKIRTKISKGASPAKEQPVEGEEQDLIVTKNKKPIEIDEAEPIVGGDEKVEEDPLAAPIEEDEATEELSLDSEELNPFGDRWEE